MADLSALAESLINGKADDVRKLTQEALDGGVSPAEVLNDGLIKGMGVVGERFKNNEFYVPEVLIAARAMHAGMDILKPVLAESGVEPIGKVLLGTVKGDLHDIGKNLVAMMLEGAGFEVVDLGIDVSPEKFVEAVKEGGDIVAMSALLTTTMTAMKTTLGGAPVTQNYADEIGADGYARDAASAADKAKELIGVG
jgi:5-methyltetrahydrofolate--homocysteine methyltransferase